MLQGSTNLKSIYRQSSVLHKPVLINRDFFHYINLKASRSKLGEYRYQWKNEIEGSMHHHFSEANSQKIILQACQFIEKWYTNHGVFLECIFLVMFQNVLHMSYS